MMVCPQLEANASNVAHFVKQKKYEMEKGGGSFRISLPVPVMTMINGSSESSISVCSLKLFFCNSGTKPKSI